MISTKALPTTTPSAKSFTLLADLPSLIPKPITTGQSVTFVSFKTFFSTSFGFIESAPVIPLSDM